MRKHMLISAVFSAVVCFSGSAMGSGSYPERPIRLVVPVPPGGAADFIGRLVAEKLGSSLGQTVVVENRAGASGTIASQGVAKAPADGYTLLLSSSTSHGTAPVVLKQKPYDPVKDFSHIGLVATVPAIIVVNADLPIKSVGDLIAYAKKNPGKLNYGSSGSGSPLHLWGELYKSATGTSLTHIPYKGAGPAVFDLMAGRIQIMFDGLPSQLGNIQAGKTRGLAAMSTARSAVLPDLPTMGELGFPKVVGGLWFGISGPAGMPQPIIDKLSKAIFKVVQMPDIQQAFASRGVLPTPMAPGAYADFIQSENEKYAEVAKGAGISLD